MEIKNHETLYTLQIFRGLAALIVLMAHANLLVDKSFLKGAFIPGWSGVDFFFILSGFIIFFMHYSDIGKRKRILPYLKKRFNRIFPIYWLYTICVLLFTFLVSILLHREFITWIELNTINILRSFFLFPTDTSKNIMPIIPAAWTLTYELQFYFFFALLIFFPKNVSKAIISLWGIFIMTNLFLDLNTNRNLFLNVLISSKNIEFFIGCVIAYAYINLKKKETRAQGIILLVVGVLLLSISWFNALSEYIYFPDYNHSFSFGIPYGCIILGGILVENAKKSSVGNESKIKVLFVYLGDASYSIYLTHFITIMILKQYFRKIFRILTIPNSYCVIIYSIIALFLALICYNYIEKPLLKYGKRILN